MTMRFLFCLLVSVFAITAGYAAQSSKHERVLMKLNPEERAQQVCVMKGLDAVRRDKRLKRVDRLVPDTFGRSRLEGDSVHAKGAAVRAGKSWYALKFDCKLADNHLKVTEFSYELGAEIPPEQWEDVGLWR